MWGMVKRKSPANRAPVGCAKGETCIMPGVLWRAPSAPAPHDRGSAFGSDLEAFQACRMEQLTRFQPAAGQSLCIMPGKETIKDVLVFRKTVWPEVEPHQ